MWIWNKLRSMFKRSEPTKPIEESRKVELIVITSELVSTLLTIVVGSLRSMSNNLSRFNFNKINLFDGNKASLSDGHLTSYFTGGSLCLDLTVTNDWLEIEKVLVVTLRKQHSFASWFDDASQKMILSEEDRRKMVEIYLRLKGRTEYLETHADLGDVDHALNMIRQHGGRVFDSFKAIEELERKEKPSEG